MPSETLSSQPQTTTTNHTFTKDYQEPTSISTGVPPPAARTLLDICTTGALLLELSRGNSRGPARDLTTDLGSPSSTEINSSIKRRRNIHSEESLLGVPAAIGGRKTENPPIDAFESWFNNDRKAASRRSGTAPISKRFSEPPGEGMSTAQALRERLARSREERNAKVAATRDARNTLSPYSSTTSPKVRATASRSPSIALVENNLVGESMGGKQTVLAVSQDSPTWEGIQTETTHIQTQPQSPFGTPHLAKAEYVIGLPLRTKTVTSKVMDQKAAYIALIARKCKEIQTFLSNPDAADDALVRTMKEILEQSGRIATHPDLPFEKVEISNTAAEKEAEYHAAMSSKFVFLRAFLGAVKQFNLKVVIVAEKGKLIDILEIFLRGIRISYVRADRITLPRIDDKAPEGLVKVHLVPSSKSGAVTIAADCLIAMDSTFDADLLEVQHFRNDIIRVDKLAPVIRLVAINTIEHIRLCSPPGQEIPLHVYIETLKNLRQQVGVASQEYGSAISRAPTKISKWLQKKAEGELDIPSIPELPPYETATQTKTTTTTNAVSSLVGEGKDKRKRQEAQNTMSLPVGTKRLRVHDPEPESSLPTVCFNQLQVGDITHISDSMQSESLPSEPVPRQILPVTQPQTQAEAEAALDVAQDILASSPMGLESETEEALLEDVGVTFAEIAVMNDLDMEFMSREDLVAELKRKVEDLQQWMESTGRLQTRHEELRRKFVETKKELKKSQKTQKDAETRKERALNVLAKLKDERTKLQKELKEARDSLLAGPPNMAKVEQLRAEKEKLEERLCWVESSLQVREKEFEFLRERYQKTSNDGLELSGENKRLREANLHLEKRSSDVAVQLRQIQQDNQVQARDKQIENLSLQLKEREERIARLEHERQVSTRSRGPIGMRGSSVSIRGSPIQSRATSPATGAGFHGRESLTHPLRHG